MGPMTASMTCVGSVAGLDLAACDRAFDDGAVEREPFCPERLVGGSEFGVVRGLGCHGAGHGRDFRARGVGGGGAGELEQVLAQRAGVGNRDVLGDLLEHGFQYQSLAAAPAPVEAGGVDARPAGDALEAERRIAALGELGQRRRDRRRAHARAASARAAFGFCRRLARIARAHVCRSIRPHDIKAKDFCFCGSLA